MYVCMYGKLWLSDSLCVTACSYSSIVMIFSMGEGTTVIVVW
jgi:hypothetical protein